MSPAERGADLLRRAAATMRRRAAAANTDEARRPYGDPRIDPVPESGWPKLINNYLGGEVGEHCANLTPYVALCLADWLDDTADRLVDTAYRVDDDWVARNYRAPLEVAGAYLQERY